MTHAASVCRNKRRSCGSPHCERQCGAVGALLVSSSAQRAPGCDARSIRVPQQASFVRLAPLRAHPDSRVHVATSTAAAALGGEEGEASLLELPAAGTPMLLMVTVTAADGVTTSTYTITIQVRGAGYGFSN